MVVNPSVPAKTLPEFIAYAKANPGKINMASLGIGSTPHVNGELFKVMTGTNMVHVPYRSAAAVMTDLLSGQVQLYFGTTASSLEYVRTGKLRALAVTIERRLDALPDIPTVGDFVPGYEATNWYGIGAPRNTPVEVIEKLNKETNAGLADPKIKARLADLGGSALGLARRLRQAHRRRNREMGQGGQVLVGQGGLMQPNSALAALRLITSSNREDCTTGHRGHAGGRSRSAHSRTASLKVAQLALGLLRTPPTRQAIDGPNDWMTA